MWVFCGCGGSQVFAEGGVKFKGKLGFFFVGVGGVKFKGKFFCGRGGGGSQV